MHRIPARFRSRHGRRSNGQGLVEFALVLPVILLLTMAALDFGRIYLGYINVQNMARVAANYAANNADAFNSTNSTIVADTLTAYRNQIQQDAAATNCALPGPAPAPVYTDANGDGNSAGLSDNATVGLTCTFHVITPFISTILGSSVNVSTSVVFPIKKGISGTASTISGCFLPPNAAINVAPGITGPAPFDVTFTDASGGCPATSWEWRFFDGTTTTYSYVQDPPSMTYSTPGTYTADLRATNGSYGYTDAPTVTITVTAPSSTPPPCTVPLFSAGGGVTLSAAPGIWGAAGFTGAMTQVDENPGNATTKIKAQSLVGGSSVPCDSPITVTSN
jgi:Flp pilus assembly protein TadG